MDRGEADKPGTELGEETGPSRNEDGAVSRPETREVSQREIGKIWGFEKIQPVVLLLLSRQEIAQFLPLDDCGNFLVRVETQGFECLILLGILQGARQAVP